MNEPTALFSVFGLDVYPYGLCAAAAAGLGCLLLVWLWKKHAGKPLNGLRFALYAVPCCLLFSRAGYCAVRAGFIAVDFGGDFAFRFDLGGYSLAGGFVGLLLAAWLFGKVTKTPFASALDLAAPAALLVVSGLRLAERFTLDGVGGYVENEALQWFPLAVRDTYGDFVTPIFFWEALAALLMCAGLVRWMGKAPRRRGDAALTGMLLFGLCQILLESLRADDYLRFGFVRVNQLWGIALALAAAGVWAARLKPRPLVAAALGGGALACVALLILVEFGLDKSSISNGILYAVMTAVLLLLAWTGLALRNRSAKGDTGHAMA